MTAIFTQLSSEQIRQTIDTEQVFGEWLRTSQEIDHRFRGSMAWKTVSGYRYLYRKTEARWKSLGPQSEETERMHRQFHEGRRAAKDRLSALVGRLDQMAAINRAMRIGRLPVLTARLLRALGKSGLIGTALDIVGTNALYAYERLSGIRIESGLLATGDIDLLFDGRAKLKLIGRPDTSNLIGTLQDVDKTFHLTGKASFRAANANGFLVDLITPAARNRFAQNPRTGLSKADDLVAVEIEGLQWLMNSPKVEVILIDERGYPVRCSCPDPRSFALHKMWLAQRADRDAIKRLRDRQQAEAVAEMIARHLPHLRFDDPALSGMPKLLRERAAELVPPPGRSEPDW